MSWEELLKEWRSAGPEMECHTSGSTGRPSTIWLPKEEMKRSARRTIDFFGINSGSHLYSCIAPDFIGGKMMLIRGEVSGARFSWEKPSNHPLKDYGGGRIDLISVVPSQLLYMLEHREELPEIGAVLVGGAALNEWLRRRVGESGLRVYESYGMTETASHIALRRVGLPQEGFIPLEGISISLDARGCLTIEIEGWKKITTNDIAEIDPEGRFRILGRADNVIISGGIKIHPEEVEGRLAGVFDFDVMLTSRAHPKWGEEAVLIAETEPRNEEECRGMILEKCKEVLPAYSVPKDVRFGKLSRTANGKLKRGARVARED